MNATLAERPPGANLVPQEITPVYLPSPRDEFRWWSVLGFLLMLFFFNTFPEHDEIDTL